MVRGQEREEDTGQYRIPPVPQALDQGWGSREGQVRQSPCSLGHFREGEADDLRKKKCKEGNFPRAKSALKKIEQSGV